MEYESGGSCVGSLCCYEILCCAQRFVRRHFCLGVVATCEQSFGNKDRTAFELSIAIEGHLKWVHNTH